MIIYFGKPVAETTGMYHVENLKQRNKKHPPYPYSLCLFVRLMGLCTGTYI